MTEAVQPIIPNTTPNRPFEGHTASVTAVAVIPDGCRMMTSSHDNTLCLWDLKCGVVLKKMEGHSSSVQAVAASGDGQLIASGDQNGGFIAWDGGTGESPTQTIRGHSDRIRSLDFSPDGGVLATGSYDWTTKLWCTKSWQVQGNPINCGHEVNCIRYSPSGAGELLAIATNKDIEIWNPRTRERTAKFKGATNSSNLSLAWTPNGTRLFSAGSRSDPTIREWDTLTWQQVGDFWNGHTDFIHALAVNSTGTLVASASYDYHVRLWRLSDRRTIAIFTHTKPLLCVAFSMDGKHVFSGGDDRKVSEWAVPEDALLQDVQEQTSEDASEEPAINKILHMNTTVHNAYIIGHLLMAEELLTQEIDADGNNNHSYANRSLLMARKCEWDNALHDALRYISIQPSLIGHVSQGIALCGKKLFRDAMIAFDLACLFTGGDSRTILLLLLIKAIALFNANEHEEAMLRIKELIRACTNADIPACHIVEAYLFVQLGDNALDHNEAADHFTAAVKSIPFSSKSEIRSKYEVFVVVFGWDLESFWQSANQKRCDALLRAGRIIEALKSYRYMMDISDESTRANCLDWTTGFKQDCGALFADNGDAAFAAINSDVAIELYSAMFDLDSTVDSIFATRCNTKLEKMLWDEALLDAQKVTELNPSSYLGYQLKHAALHGAQKYDDAIAAFEIMLSKLDVTPDGEIRSLRRQYISSLQAKEAIQEVIHTQLDNTPHRLLNTFTGRLCNRGAQINAFKTSTEYKELLSLSIKHAELRMEHIKQAVATYFSCAMLSHKWEENELLLQDIQDKVVYELNSVGGVVKLQSFCKTAREAGFRWAWIDTCCIDQTNNVEVQTSVNSMFVWYRHSALTTVYLLDVPPSSKSGALAKSIWNKRGWTVQEFLAPKVVLFYQNDWTLYLGDRSPNHKESFAIMQELADATGIDPRALVAFRPEMRFAREKLQWASARVTTLQEDMAYSLFGIFGIYLPVIYGEKKQNALGRLLQEIVARSGDISALDWVENHPSSIVVCRPTLVRTKLCHPRCHLYPKIRFKHRSPRCERSWLWTWLTNSTTCSTA